MRDWVHIPHGILAAVLLRYPQTRWIGLGFLVSFLAYEKMQNKNTRDESHLDIKSFLYGFVIAATAMSAVNIGRKVWRWNKTK